MVGNLTHSYVTNHIIITFDQENVASFARDYFCTESLQYQTIEDAQRGFLVIIYVYRDIAETRINTKMSRNMQFVADSHSTWN